MRKILDTWATGWECLITNKSISFNTYFTIIFTEITYLFVTLPEIAIPFSILLMLCIANICTCSYIKKNSKDPEKTKSILPKVYIGILLIILIIASLISFDNIGLMLYPFLITAICIIFKLLNSANIFNKIWHTIVQILVTFAPGLIFSLSLTSTSLSTFGITIFIIILVTLMPFFAYIENKFASCNIFEMALDESWNK